MTILGLEGDGRRGKYSKSWKPTRRVKHLKNDIIYTFSFCLNSWCYVTGFTWPHFNRVEQIIWLLLMIIFGSVSIFVLLCLVLCKPKQKFTLATHEFRRRRRMYHSRALSAGERRRRLHNNFKLYFLCAIATKPKTRMHTD